MAAGSQNRLSGPDGDPDDGFGAAGVSSGNNIPDGTIDDPNATGAGLSGNSIDGAQGTGNGDGSWSWNGSWGRKIKWKSDGKGGSVPDDWVEDGNGYWIPAGQ